MHKRILVFLAVVCLSVPLLAEDSQSLRARLIAEATAQIGKGAVGVLNFNGGKADILSFSWGATQSVAIGGGAVGGKTEFQDFHLTKRIDAHSGELFKGVATGKPYMTATIDILDDKGGKVATVKLTDVIVSSYRIGGAGDLPIETVAFSYAAAEYILIGL